MTIADPNNNTHFNFVLNPQEYKVTRPHRVTAIKTMSDIVIEDFNSDIPVLTFSGHTGWDRGKGKERFDALASLLESYATRTTNYGGYSGEPLYFYNYTDDVYYRVHLHPDGYNFSRSVENPLIYKYEITFYIVSNTATYSNPSDKLVKSEELTTKDVNTTASGTYGRDLEEASTGDATVKDKNSLVSNTVNNVPANNWSSGMNVGLNKYVDKDGNVVITNAPKNIGSLNVNMGYTGTNVLGNTNVGSTRLSNNIGVD